MKRWHGIFFLALLVACLALVWSIYRDAEQIPLQRQGSLTNSTSHNGDTAATASSASTPGTSVRKPVSPANTPIPSPPQSALGAATTPPLEAARQASHAPLQPASYLQDGRLIYQKDTQAAPEDSVFQRISIYQVPMNNPLLRTEEWIEKSGQSEIVLSRTAMVADHVMVKTDPDLSQAHVENLVQSLGGEVRKTSRVPGLYLISFPLNGQDPLPEMISQIGSKSQFRVVEPDFIWTADLVPNDPLFLQQWALQDSSKAGIDAAKAWDITRGNSSVLLGVIDTGIDYNHPDLAPNIWTNPGEIAGNGIDDDHNGYIDDVHGWDFVNNDSDPMDDHFHGTHVSGTIGAASNNGSGVVGVCWSVKLMALKFLSASGSGTTSDAIEAIHYATSQKVFLTSNSWGGGGYSKALEDEIAAARDLGILFIAAAGNNGSNTDNFPVYPAGYNYDNVISVAATGTNDDLASFSNYGISSVDIAAPGVGILSTFPTTLTAAMASSSLPTSYGSISGTSMATPHVAGACALLKSFQPSLTYAQIREIIFAGGDRNNSLSGRLVTGARLNINKSIESVNGLILSPSSGLSYQGPVGGPFNASPSQWTLSNPGNTPYSWSASSNQSWAELSPSSGTLAPGQSAVISGQITSAASGLPVGNHIANITVLNTTTGNKLVRTISLRIEGVGSLPFNEDFESGALSPYWTSGGFSPAPTSTFRNLVTSAFSPQGGQHLVMDASANTAYPVRNEMTLALNLAGCSSVKLSFLAKGLADEPDGPPPSPFAGGADFDGVAISADGLNWYEVQSLRALNGSYQEFAVDLDQAIAQRGLNYTSTFKIRFNHVDNSQAPSDGIAIDEVHVSGISSTSLALLLPEKLREGQSATATVKCGAAASGNVTVNLSASPSGRVSVPASVTIPSGQKAASFTVVATDNTVLDGSATANITAAASGFTAGQGKFTVEDDESAQLTLSVPSSVTEGSGLFVEGRINVDKPSLNDVTISLSSSNSAEIQVPPGVVLPAGATSVAFNLNVIDDQRIDGTTSLSLTASAPNWSSSSTTIQVQDNETRQLALGVPNSLDRFAGTLRQAGQVKLTGTLTQDLVVDLQSDSTSDLIVPSSVTVPAGSAAAFFDITVLENGNPSGNTQVNITASSDSFVTGQTGVTLTPGASHVRVIDQLCGDLAYSSATDRIYFSVPSSASSNANTIGRLNPASGSVEGVTAIGSSPGLLRLADDGVTLYCGVNAGQSVRKMDLNTLIPGTQFNLGTGINGAYLLDDLAVVPGQASAVAISRRWNYMSPRHAGVAIYDNGIPRSTTTPIYTGSNVLEFASASLLLGYNQETSEFKFRKMAVTGSGVTVSSAAAGLLSGYGTDFKYDGGRCYSTSGVVFDPISEQIITRLPASGLVSPDSQNQRLCYLQQSGSSAVLSVYDQTNFNLVGTIPISGLSGTAASLVHCGSDRIAFRTTGGQLHLIRSVLLSSGSNPVLLVNPATNTTLSGYAGGPFPTASYTMVNTGGGNLNWTVTNSAPWLDLNQSSGTLAAQNSLVLTATPNAAAKSLAPGTHTATLQFTNAGNSIDATTRTVTLEVTPPNTPPTLSPIADQSSGGDLPIGPLAFTVADSETQSTALTVTAVSSNPALLPQSGIQLSGTGTNRALKLSCLPNVSGTALITVTVSDGVTSTSSSFSLTVNAINDPPTLSSIGNQSVNEDQVAQGIDFAVSDPETTPDHLIISTNSSNPALLPLGNIFVSGSGANRQLTLRPAANQSGSSTVTLTVSDGELLATRTFTLTVASVNDAPTIDAIADLTLNVAAGIQNVALAGISSGAENESQSLSVTATSSNPSLIPNPTVSYTGASSSGSLSFTPAASASGVVTIAVTVSDDGGASNGGVNQTVRTFNVRIGVPTITAFLPESGPVGSLVTITGSNFDQNSALNTVYFGAVQGKIVSGTSEQLTVIVPPGATFEPLSVTARKLIGYSNKPFRISFPNTKVLDGSAFAPPQSITKSGSTSANRAFFADLNGDGKSEIITRVGGATNYFKNNTVDQVLHASMFSQAGSLSSFGLEGLAIGDLDGDGRLDLASNFSYSRNLSSASTIQMATPVSLSAISLPYSYDVAVADLDGDGRLDVVTAHSNGTVSVFRNTSNGSISFAPPVTLTVGGGGLLYRILAADIDGDGKRDIITADITNSKVAIFRNQATSGLDSNSFAAPHAINLAFKPYGIDVADLNRDGKNDLMAIGYSTFNTNATVGIFSNSATSGIIDASTFNDVFNLTAGIEGRDIKARDLNGDGKLDLVIARQGSPNSINIFFNQYASGTLDNNSFGSIQNISMDEPSAGLAIGDLDGDGKPDLCNSPSTLRVVMWKNLFGGSPSPAITNLSSYAAPVGALVRVNGVAFHLSPDQNSVYFGAIRAEVLEASTTSLLVKVPQGAAVETVSVTVSGVSAFSPQPFCTTSAGTRVLNSTHFSKRISYGPGTSSGTINYLNPIVAGDLDQDGKMDVVMSRYTTNTVTVYRNTHAGGSLSASSFAAPFELATDIYPGELAIRDIDGDGKPDLCVIIAASAKLSVFRNTSTPGNISFAAREDFSSGGNSAYLCTADIDLDGKLDFIAPETSHSDGVFHVLRNMSTPGALSFAAPQRFQYKYYVYGSNNSQTIARDLDGDGKIDWAAAGTTGIISGRGNSSIGSIVLNGPWVYADRGTTYLQCADMNGDNKPDLISKVYNASSAKISCGRNIASSGTIDTNSFVWTEHSVGTDFGCPTLQDIDGDGKPDVVAAKGSESNKVVILQNFSSAGSIGLGDAVELSLPYRSYETATADLNQDGKSDIIASGSTINGFTVFENNSTDAAPEVLPIPDQYTLEDQATTLIPVYVSDSGTELDHLVVSVATSNAQLLPPSNIEVRGSGSKRSLRLTPDHDRNGSCTVTVIVSNGTLSSSTSFVVTVLPVNDAPTLDEIPPLTVVQGSGRQAIALSGITSGSSQETQILEVAANCDDHNLLSSLKPVYSSPDATGSIEFTVPAKLTGTALISVTLTDGGGTDYDGVNTIIRTVPITVISKYHGWLEHYFPGAAGLDAASDFNKADPDFDGIPNLLEYAFKTDPLQPAGNETFKTFISSQDNESYLTVIYRKRNDDDSLSYAIESSQNMHQWTSNPSAFVTISTLDNSDGTESVTVRSTVPISASQKAFIRLRVEKK